MEIGCKCKSQGGQSPPKTPIPSLSLFLILSSGFQEAIPPSVRRYQHYTLSPRHSIVQVMTTSHHQHLEIILQPHHRLPYLVLTLLLVLSLGNVHQITPSPTLSLPQSISLQLLLPLYQTFLSPIASPRHKVALPALPYLPYLTLYTYAMSRLLLLICCLQVTYAVTQKLESYILKHLPYLTLPYFTLLTDVE